MTEPTPNELLQLARNGDEDACGRLLELYRPYLRYIAQRRMDRKMQARVDASDIVQQTFLEAQRDLGKFRGEVERELIAWLRRILEHNVSESIERHLTTMKRSAKREQSMDDSRGKGLPMRGRIASDQSTPSQRVMRGEDAAILVRAVADLPADQCEAVQLRHFEGLSLKELAEHFGRSEVAVAGLLKRGLQGLRKSMARDAKDSG